MKATASAGRPATPAQIDYLTSLAEKVGHPVPDHVDLTTWTMAQASEMIDTLKAKAPSRTSTLASDRQVDYILGLLDERVAPEGFDLDEATEAAIRRLTSENASALIRTLKVQPRKPRTEQAEQQYPQVVDGHYAIRSYADGVVRFYKVYTFRDGNRGVSIQASDELHPMPRVAAEQILGQIAADVESALALYGHEIGRCGVCHRTLTDEESRARGIGPKCAAKIGI